MNKCSICEKPIEPPSTECSTNCVTQAGARGQAKAAGAHASFTKAFNQMMMTPDTGRLPKLPEASMFYIKHRWMVNRNLTQGHLVISFNEKGYAAIKDLGNNRRMAEVACRFSKGNMKLVESIEPVAVSVPVEAPVEENVVKATDIPAKEETPLVSAEEVKEAKGKFEEILPDPPAGEEVMTSAKDETKDEAKSSKKDPPPKKATKKTPGKSSKR